MADPYSATASTTFEIHNVGFQAVATIPMQLYFVTANALSVDCSSYY